MDESINAIAMLEKAASEMRDRAKVRDCEDGERSMSRAVEAFNAIEGTKLTELQGWRFMVCLKLARASAGGLNLDDYVDMSAYSSLAAECAAKE